MRSLSGFVAGFVVAAAAVASAQEYDRPGAYGALNGVYSVEYFDDVPSGLVDNPLGVSGRLGYRFTPFAALELQAEYSGDFSDVSGADLTATLVSLNAKVYLPYEQFQPYLLAGFGGAWANARPGPNEDDFFGRLGGGVDFYFSENWGVLVEAAYNMAIDDLDDADYLSIGWGLFYRF
ncbi:MAG TPA: porin family protein [Myxococcota bacterium]|nr:porin family protein [Myxococcota bacterium]